jgi:hypothetical protein
VAAFALGHGARQRAPYLDVGTYGLVGLLDNAAHGVGAGLAFLGGVAGWVLGLAAIAALMAAIFAVLLWLVGRGLRAKATWARIVAALLCLALLPNCTAALAILRLGPAIIDAAIIAGLLYALWVLGWRFADPPPATRA